MEPITATVMAFAYLMMSNEFKKGPIYRHLFPFDFPDRSHDTHKKEEKSIPQSAMADIKKQAAPKTTKETPKVGIEPQLTKEKPKKSKTAAKRRQKGTEETLDGKLVAAVVERVKADLPLLIEKLNRTPVSEAYNAVYISQIAKAQEFLNENHSADLSRVKCLLHRLLPREYFDQIEQLREHQNPQNIINIHGGQNIIAPKAEQAEQHIEK